MVVNHRSLWLTVGVAIDVAVAVVTILRDAVTIAVTEIATLVSVIGAFISSEITAIIPCVIAGPTSTTIVAVSVAYHHTFVGRVGYQRPFRIAGPVVYDLSWMREEVTTVPTFVIN